MNFFYILGITIHCQQCHCNTLIANDVIFDYVEEILKKLSKKQKKRKRYETSPTFIIGGNYDVNEYERKARRIYNWMECEEEVEDENNEENESY
jgi:hypothetical protein